MTSENDPGFNTEEIYKQLSRYPTKSILLPALKVGALTGKRLFFTRIYLRMQIYSEESGHCDLPSKTLLKAIDSLMLFISLLLPSLLL